MTSLLRKPKPKPKPNSRSSLSSSSLLSSSSSASSSSSLSSSSSAATTSSKEYEVEKILNKKTHNKTTYYKVKWIGYDEPTWEPKSNVNCDKLIELFERESNIEKNFHYEEENEWEVQEILDKRTHKGRVQYLVKWRGWPGEPTWEIADNCQCINLIAAFENPKLKKIWAFGSSNRNLWLNEKQMLDYMRDFVRKTNRKINLLNFERDYPVNEKQLPLKEGLNIGPLCYENHWYLVIILDNTINIHRRQILVGDALNTLIGTNYLEHPVLKRLKKVYSHYPIKPVRMTHMERSDVCAFYTLAAFERALYLYQSIAHFVVEQIFFSSKRTELIRGFVKPESHGEMSLALPLPVAFDHGPKCEFCDELFDSFQSVDEHIERRHFTKRKRPKVT